MKVTLTVLATLLGMNAFAGDAARTIYKHLNVPAQTVMNVPDMEVQKKEIGGLECTKSTGFMPSPSGHQDPASVRCTLAVDGRNDALIFNALNVKPVVFGRNASKKTVANLTCTSVFNDSPPYGTANRCQLTY